MTVSCRLVARELMLPAPGSSWFGEGGENGAVGCLRGHLAVVRLVRVVWLDPWPGVLHRGPKPANCPTRRRSPARHFGPFVPGKGGSAQGRSRMEHRNQIRVPGVFISYHGACRRLALL